MCKPVNHNPKHVAEAAEQGAVIVGAGRSRNYRKYRLDCGHEQEVTTSSMRNGGFRCQTCLENKLDSEAAEQGAVVIGAGRDANYRKYKLECGHEQEVHVTSMRKGQFRCQTCLENKLNAEAAERGAEIIGAGRNKDCRTYRLECGHEQEIQLSGMRKGQFRCQTCLENKLHAEASDQGAVIVGAGRIASYRTYRLNCGHEQEIQLSGMRVGNFNCQTCEDTSRTLPSYVYLLHIINGEHEFLKLGYAKNIDLRVSRYGLPETAIVNHVTALRFETGNEAHEFETALHSCMKSEQLSERKAKSYGMTRSGHTECYPVDMLDKLQAELR